MAIEAPKWSCTVSERPPSENLRDVMESALSGMRCGVVAARTKDWTKLGVDWEGVGSGLEEGCEARDY